ncbi:MAG: hypothetical protein MJ016_03345 [Victivallaceae bacterium]|nr:hypothetical protein [Victivallaceae bacterium]
MKQIASVIVLGLAFCFSGCRDTVVVNGEKYAMLRESEINELKAVARATLRHNLDKGQVVTQDEYLAAMNTEPQCTVDYFQDLEGTVRFTWRFPRRKTTVVIRGELLNPTNRIIAVGIEDDLPAVIDKSNRLSPDSPLLQAK